MNKQNRDRFGSERARLALCNENELHPSGPAARCAMSTIADRLAFTNRVLRPTCLSCNASLLLHVRCYCRACGNAFCEPCASHSVALEHFFTPIGRDPEQPVSHPAACV